MALPKGWSITKRLVPQENCEAAAREVVELMSDSSTESHRLEDYPRCAEVLRLVKVCLSMLSEYYANISPSNMHWSSTNKLTLLSEVQNLIGTQSVDFAQIWHWILLQTTSDSLWPSPG
jgi:hypothetical protein